jgi:hypothetical protein
MDEAPGACLCRRYGFQIRQIAAAVPPHSARARTRQGVEANRPEQQPTDAAISHSRSDQGGAVALSADGNTAIVGGGGEFPGSALPASQGQRDAPVNRVENILLTLSGTAYVERLYGSGIPGTTLSGAGWGRVGGSKCAPPA